LGSHQHASADPRRDRNCDANAVDGRRPAFTERDWLFRFRHPQELRSLHLWLRFAMLWLAVVLVAFVEGYVLLSFGLAVFLGAVFLTALVVWRVAPKWLL
jgi:hypothetical protein